MTENPTGPLAGKPLGVIDLHTHPTLKTYMFRRKFWKRYWTPAFTFPITLRTHLDALIDGNVQVALAATYVVEHGWLDNCWPIKLVYRLWEPTRRIFTEAPDDMCREQLNHLVDMVRETRARRGDVVEIAYSYDEMQRIRGEGKVCLVNSLEGCHHLNGDLDNLDDFAARGVAHMIIPHMYPNEAGECVDAIPEKIFLRKLGCFTLKFDPESGLTDWGRDLVAKMCDIGMVPDVTHGTPNFRRDVYETVRAQSRKRPVIMSHVGVHHCCPSPMNPAPEDIRAIADTGGVVGLIAMTWWLHDPEKAACREVILESIDHLIEHGGEDVVAFGSDFDGFTGPPTDWRSPADYQNIREFLLQKYTETQVEKFLAGNADRVLRAGWGR